jgi:hypothetical protein
MTRSPATETQANVAAFAMEAVADADPGRDRNFLPAQSRDTAVRQPGAVLPPGRRCPCSRSAQAQAPSRPPPCPRPRQAKSAPCHSTASATTPPWRPRRAGEGSSRLHREHRRRLTALNTARTSWAAAPLEDAPAWFRDSAPATPIPSCSSRSGTPGRRCFSWTRPNRYAVHSPYAVPGAGPGQRPGGRHHPSHRRRHESSSCLARKPG